MMSNERRVKCLVPVSLIICADNLIKHRRAMPSAAASIIYLRLGFNLAADFLLLWVKLHRTPRLGAVLGARARWLLISVRFDAADCSNFLSAPHAVQRLRPRHFGSAMNALRLLSEAKKGKQTRCDVSEMLER